ncbi:MAG: hypothetical protein AAF532_02805 [Planctomycetota bacterium]
MFGLEMVTAAIASEWKEELGAGVDVVTPGRRLDGDASSEWAELDVELYTGRAGRPSGRFDAVTVIANVFAKAGEDAYRAREIADTAKAAFDGRTVAVPDYDLSGRPVIGYVRLGEATLRDLTRSTAVRQELSQCSLIWRGTAQPIAGL